jgi:glycosyltransferase involved in cell wall biosynthesis
VQISVVIPTCNRRARLLSVLADLDRSTQPVLEVLVVDSSDEKLTAQDLAPFQKLRVRYLESVKSVCVQRNRGIREARGEWIFLCDDDLEVPPGYLGKLVAHAQAHPEAGAVSGLFLERRDGRWESQHPVASARSLLWSYVFQLGVWGEIRTRGPFIDAVVERYRRSGNHISRAGWPVITDFSAPYFRTPIYSLGAALVKREWLLGSPYDERLDPQGFGDNYGVAIGFPGPGIHIVTGASVHHHKDEANRSSRATAYRRRTLALHHFITTRGRPPHVTAGFFAWSLVGQAIFHALKGDLPMAQAALATMLTVLRGRNPYSAA